MKHQRLTNYEAQRNLLIPIAERFANAISDKEPEKTSKHYRIWADTWNQTFHGKMDELARGL